MKRAFGCFVLLLVLAACRSTPPPAVTPVAGHGAISIEVVPNPIVASRVSGNTFEFPFDIVVRETGGRAVTITSVSVAVRTAGGFTVGRDHWDAERIRSTGTSTSIPALSEARYHFNQRKDVPDERFLNGLSAELRVSATDETGAETSAVTAVTLSH